MWPTLSCMTIKKKNPVTRLMDNKPVMVLTYGSRFSMRMLKLSLTSCSIQMILLRWSTFLLGSLALTLSFMLFWIDLFLLDLIFVLKWLLLHWEILIMLFYYWLSFKLKGGCPLSSQSLRIFHCWLGQSLWAFERSSRGGYV